ncbi:MAG: glycosyltransferase [Gemmatimonadetes bacterium]|nr:glycosyltransferase [Gemmatimonadota bacterium]
MRAQGPREAATAPAEMEARIILAHNGARIFGGAEIWTVRLLQGLQERGHRVVFLCRDPEMVGRAEALGVPAEVAHLGGHPVLPHAVRFAAILRRHRPDGLLLSTFKKTWLGGMGARLARVPRVVARIGTSTDLPGRSPLYRVALRRWVHRIVVNADHLRGPVLADLPGLEPERVVTVYSGITARRRLRPPGAVRAELGLAPGDLVIGTVARLVEEKRIDRFLETLAALTPDVRGIVAGDGPEREALEARAGELGVAHRVSFVGHRDDVGDVLDALDVFLLTSDREGLSNAMLEALAAGVPVVSTPVSGAREALEPLSDGSAPGVVARPDPPALRAAVGSLLTDPARRKEMAGAALRRVGERFDQESRLRVWEELLGGDTKAVPHEGPSPLRPGGEDG